MKVKMAHAQSLMRRIAAHAKYRKQITLMTSYIETKRKTQCMQSGVNAIKKTCELYVPYMAPYLMNHYLRKYLIKGVLPTLVICTSTH
jgi:uncharacterized protein YgiB involved in biofilm formation